MMLSQQRSKLVKSLLENEVLVTEQVLNAIPENFNFDNFYNNFSTKPQDEEVLLNEINLYLQENNSAINQKSQERKVKIVVSYTEQSKKRTVADFITYYNKRYQQIKKILLNRMELSAAISINKIFSKTEKEQIAIIGIIIEKTITKNNNIVIKLEDPSGEIIAIINKNKPEMYELAKNLVLDEIIGIVGLPKNKVIYISSLFLPDIPLSKELKKAPEEEYAVFISDIHTGSRFFLEEQFKKFICFLNSEIGNETYKKIAEKIKYLFIVGDLVDGVGIYPAQEKELLITDITQQYIALAKLLEKVPNHISMIICPGNHDAVRLCEPQPQLDKEFAKELYQLKNAFFVSNPAIVNIAATETFAGIDVLMYHGYSFDYFIANIDEVRNNGGYDRADLVMKFLLQKRHLAPTHSATVYIPE